jgi:hypothetical protein
VPTSASSAIPSPNANVLPPLARSQLSLLKVEGTIPVEIKPQPVDVPHVFLANIPFLVTIVVVVAAAAVNYFVNRRTILNQETQSAKSRQAEHQNKISEYRHAWLQELRNTSAEFIKAVYDAQSTLMQWNLSRDYVNDSASYEDEKKFLEYKAKLPVLYVQEKQAAAELYKYSSKIKLLFKKDDPQVAKLFQLLDGLCGKVGNLELRGIETSVIDEVVLELQTILKHEWEVTKERIEKK